MVYNSIMAYYHMPYVGMTLKKNGSCIKSVQMTRLKCLHYQALLSASMSIRTVEIRWRELTDWLLKWANHLSSDCFLLLSPFPEEVMQIHGFCVSTYATSSGDIRYDDRSYVVVIQRKILSGAG